jgi:putative endonuclease
VSRRRKDLGDWGEAEAARHLETKGYLIVGRQVRTGLGEIDLVALDRETLVFVEVKALERIPDDGVDPAENVHRRKQRRLGLAARAYLAGLDREPYCRFDVVTLVREPALRVEHHAGAFVL